MQDLKARSEGAFRKFISSHDSALTNLEKISPLSQVIGRVRSYASFDADKLAGITVKGVKYSAVNPMPFKVGEYAKLGNYPQNNGSAKEPIEWLVLESNEITREMLLVSRYGLDFRQYHHECVSMTWEQCDLRKWLNHEFLRESFSEMEQNGIMLSEVANDNNRKFGTRGGKNTRDRIFCLSLAEAERYFKNDGERQCRSTAHARNQAVSARNSSGWCNWWLRSPGCNQGCASGVCNNGVLSPVGVEVNFDYCAVRPALRITASYFLFYAPL